MIKAIETRYKGYRFRSRLEARWAVFFDSLKIPWEYEKEGYDLGNEGWYLPDFWVPYEAGEPGWGFWIEIKPTPPTGIECKKLSALAKITGHRTYCLCGNPWPGEHSVFMYQHHHAGLPKRIPEIVFGRLVEIENSFEGYCEPVLISIQYYDKYYGFPDSVTHWLGAGSLESAFLAARSARFEHGESGAA
jgi:hypothetical protein